MRCDFVRHGKPTYTDEDLFSEAVEGDLTPEGVSQVEVLAASILAGFEKDGEIMIIWSSPKRRALQTADVIWSAFDKAGIRIRKPKVVWSLRDVILTGEAYAEIPEEGKSKSWMEYWASVVGLPIGMELPRSLRRRVMRVVANLERLARKANSDSKKRVRVLCITHEEMMRDILEEAYGTGTELGTGPTYGELLKVEIEPDEKGAAATLSLVFRHQNARLLLNLETREIRRL
ncbi:MAG: histidine phosphatase family protein [Candidatus Vogelbacteria bacterium]|nr:histidine phosphatase family protein [Candidatus Vogelbacteria bacterium]